MSLIFNDHGKFYSNIEVNSGSEAQTDFLYGISGGNRVGN